MRRTINRLNRYAFSLIEMALVLAISGLMVGFVLKSNTVAGPTNLSECITATKMQLNAIQNAVERFARANDRLPLPAARNVGVESPTYGRESSGANIDAAGGVSFGAVPFQALGLPASYAGDCWGNKLSYAVTTALTTNATSGGYRDATVVGNITLRKHSWIISTPLRPMRSSARGGWARGGEAELYGRKP